MLKCGLGLVCGLLESVWLIGGGEVPQVNGIHASWALPLAILPPKRGSSRSWLRDGHMSSLNKRSEINADRLKALWK